VCAAVSASLSLIAEEPRADLLVLVGAAGETEYAPRFAAAARAWQEAAAKGGARCTVVGLEPPPSDGISPDDRDAVRSWIEGHTTESTRPLWLAYLGHGSWDGREARLSLRGPDITATELAEWLAALKRPLIVVHGGSASGPFLPALSAPGRVIVTATSTGDEVNYARFGEFFARTIASGEADIDQDGQTSLLEAFLSTSKKVQDFYSEDARMATEHALFGDNGDRRGTPADWFRGTRVVRRSDDGTGVDGATARRVALVETEAERALTGPAQARRDLLERQLEELRAQKLALPEREYLFQLERILREIGVLYLGDQPPGAEAEAGAGAAGAGSAP
jgi:hypothetical protein